MGPAHAITGNFMGFAGGDKPGVRAGEWWVLWWVGADGKVEQLSGSCGWRGQREGT